LSRGYSVSTESKYDSKIPSGGQNEYIQSSHASKCMAAFSLKHVVPNDHRLRDAADLVGGAQRPDIQGISAACHRIPSVSDSSACDVWLWRNFNNSGITCKEILHALQPRQIEFPEERTGT